MCSPLDRKNLFVLHILLFFLVQIIGITSPGVCQQPNNPVYTAVPSQTELLVDSFNHGIIWSKELSWAAIQKKAKEQHRYIFVDCFASWCVPCKWMDRNVYLADTIGKLVNANFIPVRLQFDTTQTDDYFIKSWYQDAKRMREEFTINSFPSFLFFSESGEIIHKAIGSRNIEDFALLIADVKDPKRRYYQKLAQYTKHSMPYEDIRQLALEAQEIKDPMSTIIAGDYIENHLSQHPDVLKQIENINFLISFTTRSTDKGFNLLFSNALQVITLSDQRNMVRNKVCYIITKEEIDSTVLAADRLTLNKPDWSILMTRVYNKYGKYYANRTVLAAKIRWYQYKKNYCEVTKYTARFIKKYKKELSDLELNSYSWTIAQFSKQKREIRIAVHSMRTVVKHVTDTSNLLPASLDTYANLLYKLGHRKQAIQQEELALYYAENYEKGRMVNENKTTLEKMKKGEPVY
jgi:thioredoxin-related protein